MRGNAEYVNLVTGTGLNVGGKTVISDPLPVGEGWYRMHLRINEILVIGTGAGVPVAGQLNFIKNILFKTDRGEIICNLPGRALYEIASYKAGVVALRTDAIAAASATYSTNLPMYFAEHYRIMDRPEDTILNTQRYSSMTLEITLGTVADLSTVPGTATVTATADIEVIRTKGLLPQKGGPAGVITYDFRNPVDANVLQFIFMERAQDLALKRVYVHSCTGGTAGVPWAGIDSDVIQNIISIKDQSGFIIKDRIHRMIQESNQVDYSLETVNAGVEVHDFVQEGSIQAALLTGGKSLLQYQWTNQAGVGANSIITLVTEGVRSLK
jgi:hypothetical protein